MMGVIQDALAAKTKQDTVSLLGEINRDGRRVSGDIVNLCAKFKAVKQLASDEGDATELATRQGGLASSVIADMNSLDDDCRRIFLSFFRAVVQAVNDPDSP